MLCRLLLDRVNHSLNRSINRPINDERPAVRTEQSVLAATAAAAATHCDLRFESNRVIREASPPVAAADTAVERISNYLFVLLVQTLAN